MKLIFDNLVAAMIGGTVFLILLSINHRDQLALIEANSNYAMRSQALDFVYMLERDMRNLSRVVTPTEEDSTFTFYAQTSATDTTQQRVEYRRTKTGDRDGVALFQILRFVNDVYAGGSLATITSWDIAALNEQGNAVLSGVDARQIYVRFEALPLLEAPVQDGIPVKDTRWETTFRPPLLQDKML